MNAVEVKFFLVRRSGGEKVRRLDGIRLQWSGVRGQGFEFKNQNSKFKIHNL